MHSHSPEHVAWELPYGDFIRLHAAVHAFYLTLDALDDIL
jgi:hypothetical protein